MFLLNRVPYVGKFIRVVNTLLHETGHSIMALLTDGQVLKSELFSDTSGTTITKSKSKSGQVLIALAGYPFASLSGLALAWLFYNGYYYAVMMSLAGIAFINLLFFVRNAHGIFWLISFITIILVNMRFGNNTTNILLAAIVGSVVLTESLWSTFVLAYLSVSKPKNAGDASNLHKLTHIPAFIWALLFCGISVMVIYLTGLMYLQFDFKTFGEALGL